jgi:putative GTP pyrophosphokinase
VHYVVRTQAKKQRYFVEIQLRTLFEEGWSEIDHAVRYPEES